MGQHLEGGRCTLRQDCNWDLQRMLFMLLSFSGRHEAHWGHDAAAAEGRAPKPLRPRNRTTPFSNSYSYHELSNHSKGGILQLCCHTTLLAHDRQIVIWERTSANCSQQAIGAQPSESRKVSQREDKEAPGIDTGLRLPLISRD